ncbi:MAG: hypothetical protein B7Y83_09665 [Flavobacteriales bacterium 32-34-25]|nr:MAG: hypothetical protein B7Y83_09665 [Flavobacteriales bacterium 32-34-25]
MKIKLSFLIILSVFSNYLKAQNKSEENRKAVAKRAYLHYSETFKKKDYVFYKVDFNETDYFFKTIDENKIKDYLDYIKKSLKLEIIKNSNTSGFSDLKLTVNLPDFFEDLNNYKFRELYHNQIDIKNISSDLVDEFNNPLKLSYVTKEYSSKKIIYTRMFSKDTIHDAELVNFKGTIKYEMEFLTNYDKIEISLDQIGSEFMLGKASYKLIDYFNNPFIIKKLSGPLESIYIVNLTEDGKLTKPYSYSEFNNLKENDSAFVNKNNFYNSPSSGVPEFFYHVFKNEPNITFGEFEKLMTFEKIEELNKFNYFDTIIMLPTVSNLNPKYILYTPQYKTEIIEINK